MISERDIAEKFNVVWKQNFPLLTPGFMKVFNETNVKVVNEFSAITDYEVRYDLVSEAAFNLAQMVLEDGIKAIDYLSSSENVRSLTEKTAKSIWPKEKYTNVDTFLSNFEIEDTINICKNTVEFVNKLKKKTVKFRPRLKGYGVVQSLEADIEIDDSLFEIKTVMRNFKSSDLKQLFIYLALKQVSEKSNWKHAGLYNPRRGTYCKFNIINLVDNVTGGKSPNEAFEDLLNSLIRDLEIDAKF